MGLAGARNAAVTGLQAQSTGISISADNIANASTPGYKAVKAAFSTLVTSSGSANSYASGGVSVNPQTLVETQGLIESTGRVTDLAISGSGFFSVADDNGTLFLTRAGSFAVNNKGELVNAAGFRLLGWPLDNDGRRPGEPGNANTTAAEATDSLEVVDTNAASGTASPTTSINVGLNLNAGQSTFQGATIVFNPPSGSENDGIAQTDIIAPGTAMQQGDAFSLTANSATTTFQYGGFAVSKDVAETIFGAITPTTTFATASGVLVEGDQFTITPSDGEEVTFTFTQNAPDTNNGEFKDLDTLATAINAVDGLTARVVGTTLYVSADDATAGLAFGDVSGSNLHNELGFSDIAAAAAGVNRWNTFDGLATLVNTQPDLGALVNNGSSNASIDLYAADPLQILTIEKIDYSATVDLQSDENGTNGSDDIIVPVEGSSMANGQTISFNDDQDAAGNTVTVTYGGIEESDAISTTNTMFGASTTAGLFTVGQDGLADQDTFTIQAGALGARTFRFENSGVLGAAEFNSLDTLATAINTHASGDFNARIVNNRLYISAADADLALDFVDGAGASFMSIIGLSDIAASGGTTRFATLGELQSIVDGNANFIATLSGSTNSKVTITTADPTDPDLDLTIDAGVGAEDLLRELGLAEGDVGDGFFTEMGIDGSTGMAAADADDSLEIEASYNPSDNERNIAGAQLENAPHFSRNVRIYDAQGTGHDFRMSFLKIGTNTWGMEFYAADPSEIDNDTNNDGLLTSGTITFNGDGSLAALSPPDFAQDLEIEWTTGSDNTTLSFDLGTAGAPAATATGNTIVGLTDGLRQFDSAYNVDFVEQNGVAAGQFNGIEVSDDGLVFARFSNGQVKAIYQLPIVTVANPNALTPKTGNVYAVSQASGEVNMKEAGVGGAGTIVAGALEGSTSDIAEELTRTIGIQSNYNANAALISTIRSMEDELNRRL